MKHFFKYLCCFFLVTGTGVLLSSCENSKEKANAPAVDTTVAYYTFSLPSKGRQGSIEEERIIYWDNNAYIHMLKLGTFTTPMTFSISYPDSTLDNPHKLLMEKRFEAGDTVIFNISTLKKGTYKMQFTAIAQGCTFDFTIQ